MNATLSIELEILQPALVTSADEMRRLHPSQIRRVCVRLASGAGEDGIDSVVFSAEGIDARPTLHDLVALAQRAQPEGTVVLVWYQGRSESFLL